MSEDAGRDPERYFFALLAVFPWVTLPVATVIAVARPGQAGSDRAVTLALAGLAAAWVYATYTRVPQERRRRSAPLVGYFVGLLALCVALMSRDQVFLLFTITGFLHAFELRPWQVGVVGVLGTSVVLHTMTAGLPLLTLPSLGTYVGVIAVQTASVGLGVALVERSIEQQRRRTEMIARLEATLEENAGLHAQLLTQAREAGVVDERQRMAGEIHDTLAQGLTGIITQVQAAQRVWHSPDQAREHVDRALDLARESLTEARRSVQALRPHQLEAAHLPEALGELVQRWADDRGVPVRFDVSGDPVPLNPAVEVALFRVAQEALHNVARHAHAARVGLALSYLSDEVLLDVRDDGQGIDMDADGYQGQGFGLRGMTQRVRSVGGALQIESAPGEGTAVSARVPAAPVAAP
ncbi:sensor histidine kinase [Cellulomonas phragmiteti]|uniref:Oxygen sensor histidine kinase NreB n=1 Tax=Cellulomonas phragmiteti TaxID=478780 RepID=A0ABQ4DMT1_9CELL|nr:sensor histidine kinase [Cellulomonas phragmiteti]GIG40654.1 histidine kinase [Cellulomonas phragmiteti]